jgi:proline iminopeptidase
MAEGMIDVTGGKVWYRTWGNSGAIPLVVVHGGPGYPSDYLHNLSSLADERQVIVYDQLGCGRSDRPADKALFVAERFVKELGEVRDALGLDEVHMFGNSWGTALAVMYQLSGAIGIRSLVLQGAYLSTRRWEDDNASLLRAMPETEAIIHHHVESGFTACPEYAAALHTFSKRHLCRVDPWPADLHRMFEGIGEDVYRTMWGPNDLMCESR